MRVFFALEPDQQTTLQIAAWRDRQFSHAGRPVPPANFHLTLAFVGELPEPALGRLCMGVEDRLAREQPEGADIALNITGYWPNPGIYWLGAQCWPGQLSSLVKLLGKVTVAAGGKRDRRAFQPHITLFRRCPAAPPAPAAEPSFRLTYRHFTLFESSQGRQGVSYRALQHWDLPTQGR